MAFPHLWFIAALGASLFWGLGYVISEILLKTEGISPLFLATATALVTFPVYLVACLYFNEWKPGIDVISQDKRLFLYLLLTAFLVVGGTFLIYLGVSEKNASLVSIIESTYPLFTIFFAYIILQQVQVNIWSGLGTLLIITGIVIVYLKH